MTGVQPQPSGGKWFIGTDAEQRMEKWKESNRLTWEKAYKAPTHIWRGDDSVLPAGVEVVVLATDPDCPDRRGAAWIRWWPKEAIFPDYRSCDICDLEPLTEGDIP